MPSPLALPSGFNSETDMIGRDVAGKLFHSTIQTVVFANSLVENGTPQDLEQAEKTIRAVLACQETRDQDPHRGNFLWEQEDKVVEDLNAVQFILFNLIPILIRWEDRLSNDLNTLIRKAVQLGLEEIAQS